MFKKIISLTFILAIVLTGCSSTASKPTDGKSDFTVGFIFVGPIGDGGWTYSHNEGRLYLENELGVKTIMRESVSDQDDSSIDVMRTMIDEGADAIIGTSFGYMDYMEQLSKEYPDVKFLHCSGYKTTENMGNYFGRIYEARYLSGIVAGLKTQTNEIGYVGAFDIPEVIRGINAFTLGVRSVNPEATIHVKWTHTWYDPVKEKEAAIALLDEGADVIAQHQDTAGPQQAAEERGLWSIGYNTDMKDMAPKAYMTAPIWNWGPYYVEQVKAMMDGTWSPESNWEGLNDGIVSLAPLTDVAPAEAKEKVNEASEKIKNESFHVFEGPIKDQSGAVKVESGVTLTDEEMLNMNWFVEGVDGKIENN